MMAHGGLNRTEAIGSSPPSRFGPERKLRSHSCRRYLQASYYIESAFERRKSFGFDYACGNGLMGRTTLGWYWRSTRHYLFDLGIANARSTRFVTPRAGHHDNEKVDG